MEIIPHILKKNPEKGFFLQKNLSFCQKLFAESENSENFTENLNVSVNNDRTHGIILGL